VIYRGFVGREFSPFLVEVTEELSEEVMDLVQSAAPLPRGSLPSNWPAFMAMQGAACLMTVWEELGVDPLGLRLIQEEFAHYRGPHARESLFGRACVEDVSDHMEPGHGIEEQVDLVIRFQDSAGNLVSEYRCSYRVPVAQIAKQ
jgi:hypothetical protein